MEPDIEFIGTLQNSGFGLVKVMVAGIRLWPPIKLSFRVPDPSGLPQSRWQVVYCWGLMHCHMILPVLPIKL